MTLQEFNLLSEDKKITAVCNQGIYLTHFISKTETINCYSIDLFFVELIYGIKNNEIIQIRSFENGSELEKYSLEFHFSLISKNIFVGF